MLGKWWIIVSVEIARGLDSRCSAPIVVPHAFVALFIKGSTSRGASRRIELRWSLTSCLSRLFLTERFFLGPTDRRGLPVTFTATRDSTRFPDVYTDIRERSVALRSAKRYLFFFSFSFCGKEASRVELRDIREGRSRKRKNLFSEGIKPES